MALTAAQRVVRERSTALYTATIKDENGDALSYEDLDALTLTLYNLADGTIINSREDQDVLNANNVTVSAAGVLAWTMQPADNPIVSATTAGWKEKHVALFEWTYSTTKKGSYEVTIEVESLEKVVA